MTQALGASTEYWLTFSADSIAPIDYQIRINISRSNTCYFLILDAVNIAYDGASSFYDELIRFDNRSIEFIVHFIDI